MKNIQIPENLYNTLMGQLEKSPFASLDDFITYILQQYSDTVSDKTEVDADSEIKKRLENLGYL